MVRLNEQQATSETEFLGNPRPMPGRYHVAVNHAEEKASKRKGTPGLELEFQVICDGLSSDGKTKTSGMTGRIMPLFLSYVSDKGAEATQSCIGRLTHFAFVTGLVPSGQVLDTDSVPDFWEQARGRELVIEVEPGKPYMDEKSGVNKAGGGDVSFRGFWSLGNKEVANVPKDATTPGMQQLAKAGGNGNQATAGNGNGSKPAGQTAAAATTATTATRSKYSDL